MANSRMDELRVVDPILTSIAQSYSNDVFIYEGLFPKVAVSKQKGKIPTFGKEAFIVRDTQRAVRAKSNRIAPSDFELISFETKERDSEISIDYLEEEEANESLNYEKRITKQLVDTIELGKEKEAADIAQDLALYPSGMKKIISTGEYFDDYALNIDPLTYIFDGMDAIRNKIARFPNTMIIGVKTYRALLRHPKLVEKIKYSGATKANKEILKELTEIPNIYVGTSVTSDNGIDISDVWKDNILLAYVDSNSQNRNEYNPSYGYTLQREGKPEVDTYYENGGKMKVIRNTDNYAIKVTAQDAAYIISNTNQNN